jgi:glyoxylase-like metal-dependent hydrolase (beta-lactamase superfamily II)
LTVPVPARFLATTTEPDQLRKALAAAGQRGEWIPAPSNVTLVRSGSDVILIDTGAGPHFMPTAGRLLDSMETVGIERESVTKVVHTHAHPDHIGGTLDDFEGEPNFPNASYLIAAAEWNFWMAEDAASRLPEDRQNFAPGARRNLSRIKDRVRTVQPGEDVVAGLRVLDTSGHTAGHIAIELVSEGQALLVVGDALTHPPSGQIHAVQKYVDRIQGLLNHLQTRVDRRQWHSAPTRSSSARKQRLVSSRA